MYVFGNALARVQRVHKPFAPADFDRLIFRKPFYVVSNIDWFYKRNISPDHILADTLTLFQSREQIMPTNMFVLSMFSMFLGHLTSTWSEYVHSYSDSH